ncbi:MAG: hypothetical protein ACXVZ2_12880 [Gaiellaceae bacterium]
MRRLRFHARPVTWLIAAGVGVAIATRHRSLRRSKAEQAAVDRRVRPDRRSGVDRRSQDGSPPEDGERRSGEERRTGGERRGST